MNRRRERILTERLMGYARGVGRENVMAGTWMGRRETAA